MTIITIETRLEPRDEKALLDFLQALSLGRPLPTSSRTQDRARKRATRRGWAFFDHSPVTRSSRWRITDSGRDYLKLIEGEAKCL